LESPASCQFTCRFTYTAYQSQSRALARSGLFAAVSADSAGCWARRSAGNTIDWDGEQHTVEELTERSFSGVDIAFFSAGGSISKRFAPLAADAGCTVRAQRPER